MERFAHEGIAHKTYLEAALHYLHDRWMIASLISVVGVATVYYAVKIYSRKAANQKEQK